MANGRCVILYQDKIQREAQRLACHGDGRIDYLLQGTTCLQEHIPQQALDFSPPGAGRNDGLGPAGVTVLEGLGMCSDRGYPALKLTVKGYK